MKSYVRNFLLISGIATLFLVFSLIVSSQKDVRAQTDQEKLEQLTKAISDYENQIKALSSQASTLSNQIAQYDAQIKLTSLKITQTEEKILLLGGRIDQLEVSLQALSSAYANRVVRTYKMSRTREPLLVLITSKDLNSAFSSFFYLKKIEESDRNLLHKLENAQVTYKGQKDDQVILQKQLREQQNVLASQKSAKKTLLDQTKNNEKKYQELLASAKAEFEAIQAIIAGRGSEKEVGKVAQGAKIATIIQGSSCNSSGTHLHFTVSENKLTKNPFSYLKPGVAYENCSAGSCGAGNSDPFNPSGSWDWPISPTIEFDQGYGSTWAVKNTWAGRIYSFHNGIDIDSHSSSEVHAVRSGILYQGSYSGSGGCRLRYVRVHHDEGGLDTFYLHINY